MLYEKENVVNLCGPWLNICCVKPFSKCFIDIISTRYYLHIHVEWFAKETLGIKVANIRYCENVFTIGHFRIVLRLSFKARLSAKLLIWKLLFILMQKKLIYKRKVLHSASFWKWEFLELGNSLLSLSPLSSLVFPWQQYLVKVELSG